MTGCQVQGGVIPTIHHIDSCPPHNKHLNHSRTALSAGPVQGGEAMIIPLVEVVLRVVQPQANGHRVALPALSENVVHSSVPALSPLDWGSLRTGLGPEEPSSGNSRPAAPAARPRPWPSLASAGPHSSLPLASLALLASSA